MPAELDVVEFWVSLEQVSHIQQSDLAYDQPVELCDLGWWTFLLA